MLPRRVSSVRENRYEDRFGAARRYARKASIHDFREGTTNLKKRSSSMNSIFDNENYTDQKEKQFLSQTQKLLMFLQKKFGLRKRSYDRSGQKELFNNTRDLSAIRQRSSPNTEHLAQDSLLYRGQLVTTDRQSDRNERLSEHNYPTGMAGNFKKIVRKLSTKSRPRENQSVISSDDNTIRKYGQSQFLSSNGKDKQSLYIQKKHKAFRPFSEFNQNTHSLSCSSLVSEPFPKVGYGSYDSFEDTKNSEFPPKRGKWMKKCNSGKRENTKEWQDISLKLLVQEVKNVTDDKRHYFCEVYLDHSLHARTSVKHFKNDILFWGEEFSFSNLQDFNLIVIQFWSVWDRKKKRGESRGDDLIATLKIPVVNIWMKGEFEEWYKMENIVSNYGSIDHLNQIGKNDPINNMVLKAPTSYKPSAFESMKSNAGGKSLQSSRSISAPQVRLKLRYQRLEILPLKEYNELSKILEEETVPLLSTLEKFITAKTMEDLSFSFVSVLSRRNQATRLLPQLVEHEITKLDNESLAFRGNSIATKSMDCFMKLVGQEYLSKTLSEFIHHILMGNEDCEVDPTKLTQGQSDNPGYLEKNQKKLKELVNLAVQKIFKSISYFPRPLSEVFAEIRQLLLESSNGFKEEICDSVISGCIFLRFFCPAILSPSLFGLAKNFPDDPKKLRTLTLVAKSLQSLANFSLFYAKEIYMKFMNDFVEANIPLMKQFLHSISSSSAFGNSETEIGDNDMTLRVCKSRPTDRRDTLCQSKLSLCSSTTLPEDSLKTDEFHVARDYAIIHKQMNEIVKRIDEENESEIICRLKEILSQLNEKVKEFISQKELEDSQSIQESNDENIPNYLMWPPQSMLSNTSIELAEPPDNIPGMYVQQNENYPFDGWGMDLDLDSPKMPLNYHQYYPSHDNLRGMRPVDSYQNSTSRPRFDLMEEDSYSTRYDDSSAVIDSLRNQLSQLQKKLDVAYDKLEEAEKERRFLMQCLQSKQFSSNK